MRGLILCLPLLLSLPHGGASAEEGYGRLAWGTSPSASPGGETLALPADSGLSIVYRAHSQFAGRPARRWLYFVDGQLAAVVLSLLGQEDRGPAETEIFTAVRNMLSGVYGPSRQVEASEIPAGWLSREDGSPGRLLIVEEWTTPKTSIHLTLDVAMEAGGAPTARHRLELVRRSSRAQLLAAMKKIDQGLIEEEARIDDK